MQVTKSVRSLSLVAFSWLLAGCASAPKQTALMEAFEAVGMTSAEMRFRLQEFAIRYGGEMEEMALAIRAENEDPEVERNLLRWQLYGIPAYFKTLFHTDPYLSLVDS